MRCLMGLKHRRRILSALAGGGRMLEWGMGGSTAFFAEHLPPGASLTSVEHHKGWFDHVHAALADRPNVRLFLREPANGREILANATAEEDDPTHLHDYIHAVDGERFDVILVDGYARGECLLHARSLLNPGGVIFLHDAQRPWYDQPKSGLTALGHAGSCDDYPVPHLWWGVPHDHADHWHAPAPFAHAKADEAPIIVSFYTTGTPYEREVRGLIESCRALNLPHEITPVNDLGSWERNCAYKARFLSEALHRLRRPILWVDADAVLRAAPSLVDHLSATARAGVRADTDFAIHRVDGWEFASGTLFFNNTPLAAELLSRWTRLCESDPAVWDQVHLAHAWEQTVADRPLTTAWLPQTYTKIFDRPAESSLPPVVEHFQASRRTTAPDARSASRQTRPKPAKPETPPALKAAIHAARCRTRDERSADDAGPATLDLQRRLDSALAQVSDLARHAAATCASPNSPDAEEHARAFSQQVHDLQHALVRAAALRLHDLGHTRIALFGAGRHTRRFLTEPWRTAGLTVVAILDDHPRDPQIDHTPVFTPADFPLPVDAIVISSDAHEPAMLARIRAARNTAQPGPFAAPVFTIYSGDSLPPLDSPAEHLAQTTSSRRRATSMLQRTN
ncbi:MAG: class I SAM-dependent methyltransferase [Phycisphaeraceae bacterium]|nr:class I SAM-dependent methyltransferase [Phycisphaeraceae bacterium]